MSEPAVGVYICHCGTNIAEKVRVEEVREFAAGISGVVVARDYKYMCSDPGQELIRSDISNNLVNRVVVASCSPRMHEPTFRRALASAGLNGYYLEMANIREQCSWCTADEFLATQKAKALVYGAIQKVRAHRPLEERYVQVNPDTLVVGGGIAGIEAALKVAEAGFQVYLVEKEPSIGGNMAKLDKTFPTLDCAACILTPKMVAVSQTDKVRLLTLAEVEEVSGYIGNFKVKVRRHPRYVDIDKCTGCEKCTEVCPVEVPDKFNEGLSKRKAVYKYFPQAVPNVVQIEKKGIPPCRSACPAGVNVQGYVALIRKGKFREALRLVREVLPLPGICGRVCFHPCEAACRRTEVDEAVAICDLKRFIADLELKLGPENEPVPQIAPESPKVAVVGSGPAGLAAADYIISQGIQADIFEAQPEPGGLLRYGIPDYRLPKDILAYEINRIKAKGVQIKTGITVGRDVSIDTLKREGYSCVLLTTGSQQEQRLGVEGEDSEGVMSALRFLHEVNCGRRPSVGNKVIVIGGGNAAIDAARVALRLGARQVDIFYRRSRSEMPASKEEIAAAEKEGVHIRELVAPVKVVKRGNRVVGLELVRMKLLEELDKSGRPIPAPIQGSNFTVEADTVIAAIGQRPDTSMLKAQGLAVDASGNLLVDEHGQTNLNWVFAAGDLVSGPSSVVEAVASGRWVAKNVVAFLRGEPLPAMPPKIEPVKEPIDRRLVVQGERQRAQELPVAQRISSFDEVVKGFDEATAVKEASRCLNCGVCSECMECVKACDAGAINHADVPKFEEIEVGSIIVATGYEPFDPSVAPQWGYGRYDNVYTSLEFERMLNASGPTQGKVVLKDGTVPAAVAVMHCIGSRDTNYNEYCSRICCMTSLKYSHMVREKTGAKVYDFYIDMRTFGKGYEEFYNRVVQEEGIHFIRGKGAEVVQKNGKLVVRAEDTLLGVYREIPVDMVILNVAMQPRPDAAKVARIFGLQRSADGFFLESHVKLEPLRTATEGVFIAGVCQGPKDIPDAVAQGAGSAAEALRNAVKGKVPISPIAAYIQRELCGGCRICEKLCPYGAISFNPSLRVCEVNEALCKGCGTCSASCPSGASSVSHFGPDQLIPQIEGVLAV